MGKRLSTIITKTGDDGTTGLGDGTRVRKDDLRVATYGHVDELNSVLGLAATEPLPVFLAETLSSLQHDLFELGAELCIPGHRTLTPQHVEKLEARFSRINDTLPHLKEFILPGGTRAAALLHLARTVCRRAERSLVGLATREEVSPQTLCYLNRLSDLLFVMARSANKAAGVDEVLWSREPTE